MAGIGPILSCDAEELPWTALEDSLTDAIFPSCLREQPLLLLIGSSLYLILARYRQTPKLFSPKLKTFTV